MENNIIQFTVIQAVTFTLGSSLFLYFCIRFIVWVKKRLLK